MSALLEAVHFVLWYEIQQEDVKTQNVGHRQGIFFFFAINSDSSYFSKEFNFTTHNTLLRVQTYSVLY